MLTVNALDTYLGKVLLQGPPCMRTYVCVWVDNELELDGRP